MEEEKGRRVLIIGRILLVSNNRERKKKRERRGRSGLFSLSRNAVHRMVSGEEERERGERVELDARGKERGVFNSAPGHVFQIEDNGKLRDAK